MANVIREAGIATDGFQFTECIGISLLSAGEHDEGEARRGQRGYTVLIGHKFQGDGASAGLERGMNFAKNSFVRRRIEVVEKICDQHDVISGSEIYIES